MTNPTHPTPPVDVTEDILDRRAGRPESRAGDAAGASRPRKRTHAPLYQQPLYHRPTHYRSLCGREIPVEQIVTGRPECGTCDRFGAKPIYGSRWPAKRESAR